MTALEELGLDASTATEQDVKHAYKQMAMQYHPDKGGDPDMFRQATELRDRALKEVKHGQTLMDAKLQMNFRPKSRPTCLSCEGTGYRKQKQSGFSTLKFKCRKCSGRGWTQK